MEVDRRARGTVPTGGQTRLTVDRRVLREGLILASVFVRSQACPPPAVHDRGELARVAARMSVRATGRGPP
ncbi:hypothetical protein CgIS1_21255 [Frankia sp. CgS1]|nr:hypothetical protein CgIS1_21255 [Frankia sp. CgIS1]